MNTPHYKRAIEKWGKDAQLLMVFEEMGEVMQAISKVERGKITTITLLSEICDLEIMLGQLLEIYGISQKDYDSMFRAKSEALIQRLEAS